MGMKLPAELQRQLLERGIVGPPTMVLREAAASCALDGETQCVWPQPFVAVELCLTLPSMANVRMHWATKARIVKKQRRAVSDILCGIKPPPLPVKVTLTRIAPRRLDSDNLSSSCKGIRDAVAEWMGVDDASDQYEWVCQQEKGKTPMVRIEVENTA